MLTKHSKPKLHIMKKTIIGAIVGGIIIFIWQFLSWTVLNTHEAAQQYTPNQEAIMAALEANLPDEGGYYIPGLAPGASEEDMKKIMEESDGKPWASIQYHKAMDMSMGMNMARGLITNMVMVWMLCWILLKMSPLNFSNVLIASIFTGFIVFFNSPYTSSIWYQWFDIMAHFLDAMVSWIACGLWLAWWLPRK